MHVGGGIMEPFYTVKIKKEKKKRKERRLGMVFNTSRENRFNTTVFTEVAPGEYTITQGAEVSLAQL